MDLKEYENYLVQWIRDTTLKSNCKGVVVGISGGIDSAVVGLLAKKAFPNDYLTVWMPCSSSDLDEKCKTEITKEHNLKLIDVNLNPVFNSFQKSIGQNSKISEFALANSKARLRMTSLYAIAQSNNYLVLGTDNLAEWHIGYFTKFGDGGCDLLPIVHLLKREVKEMALNLNVPNSIIDREPTASLWEKQTDESEIGFSYNVIDDYLIGKVVSKEAKQRIDYLNNVSEHKRNLAKIPNTFDRNN